MEVCDPRRDHRGCEPRAAGLRDWSVPGLGHGRWHRRHHRFRGQHPARRDRELPAAQVLGYAEEQGLQGGHQVTLHS